MDYIYKTCARYIIACAIVSACVLQSYCDVKLLDSPVFTDCCFLVNYHVALCMTNTVSNPESHA